MTIDISLNTKSINDAVKRLKNVRKQLTGQMIDELLFKCCERIRELANANLELSGLNAGFIAELEDGWQPIAKQADGSYLLTNYGRAYSVEFGIGIKGKGSYLGEVPPQYEYNIQTKYKKPDGSWIFNIEDIDTLDITKENVLPNKVTGEINYEENRSIRTDGQRAVMFCYNAIMDFIDRHHAEQIWEQITAKYWG